MQAICVQPPALLDPRSPARHPALPLAPRLPTLQGRRLLLLDNGTLQRRYGPHAVMMPMISQRLRQE